MSTTPPSEGNPAVGPYFQSIPAFATGDIAPPNAALFAQAIEESSEGIAIFDVTSPEFPLVYVNAGFEAQTGYTRDEVLGQSARLIHGPDTNPATVAKIRAALRTRIRFTGEILSYRKDGSAYWNRVALTPLRGANGEVTHFVSLQSDISAHVQSNAEVQGALELLEKLNAELTRSNQRMKKNLQAAARVQQALLPAASPSIRGAHFAWAFRPCEALAGDILNLFKLDKQNVGMYVLDVTGHGTAAALLAVSVSRVLEPARHASSLVRDHDHRDDGCADHIVAPGQVADRLDQQFRWDSEIGQFFTLVYGVLNAASRSFRYVSAGHPDPLILRKAGGCEQRRSSGVPIGLASDRYEEQEVDLVPGDRVYIYSDGVPETRRSTGELFGKDRLIKILEAGRDHSLSKTLDTVTEALVAWQDSERFEDDVTLLAFEVAE